MSSPPIWFDKKKGQHYSRASRDLANAEYEKVETLKRIELIERKKQQDQSLLQPLIGLAVGAFSAFASRNNKLLEEQNELLKAKLKQERHLELQKTEEGRQQIIREYLEEIHNCTTYQELKAVQLPFWASQEARNSHEHLLELCRKHEEDELRKENEAISAAQAAQQKRTRIIRRFLLYPLLIIPLAILFLFIAPKSNIGLYALGVMVVYYYALALLGMLSVLINFVLGLFRSLKSYFD